MKRLCTLLLLSALLGCGSGEQPSSPVNYAQPAPVSDTQLVGMWQETGYGPYTVGAVSFTAQHSVDIYPNPLNQPYLHDVGAFSVSGDMLSLTVYGKPHRTFSVWVSEDGKRMVWYPAPTSEVDVQRPVEFERQGN